jgi:hypothetical protein
MASPSSNVLSDVVGISCLERASEGSASSHVVRDLIKSFGACVDCECRGMI